VEVGTDVLVRATGEIGIIIEVHSPDYHPDYRVKFKDDSSDWYSSCRLMRLCEGNPKVGDSLGTGRHRRTIYIGNGFVRKFPTCESGERANEHERRMYVESWDTDDYFHQKLAPCRLLKDGSLIMRHVRCDFALDFDWDSLPGWTHDIDCQQVGYYKGRIVAYDYAG
jgi:hypothetical protein